MFACLQISRLQIHKRSIKAAQHQCMITFVVHLWLKDAILDAKGNWCWARWKSFMYNQNSLDMGWWKGTPNACLWCVCLPVCCVCGCVPLS